MQKYGGFIPGIRPGKRTSDYIDRILTRVTLPGAIFLAFIAVLPDVLIKQGKLPVLLRRHGAPHRGRRDARHAPADRDAPPDEALRRIHEERPPAGQTVLGGFRRGSHAHRHTGAPGLRQGNAGVAHRARAGPRAPVDGGHAPRRRGAQVRSRRRGGDLHEARAPRFGRDRFRPHRRGARRGEGHGLDHGRFSAEPRAGRGCSRRCSRSAGRRSTTCSTSTSIPSSSCGGSRSAACARSARRSTTSIRSRRRRPGYATRAAGPSSSVPTTRKTTVRRRLAVYKEQTAPVIDYFREAGRPRHRGRRREHRRDIRGDTPRFEMIAIRSRPELDLIRRSGEILVECFAKLEEALGPGVETRELDRIAEEFIRSRGAAPAFKGYQGYPASICASVNEQVVHGIPGRADARGGRHRRDRHRRRAKRLLRRRGAHLPDRRGERQGPAAHAGHRRRPWTSASTKARDGKHLSDVSHAIQRHAESNGFSVVRTLVGHGIGSADARGSADSQLRSPRDGGRCSLTGWCSRSSPW